EEGSGPVVTAGSVVSGLERMFMGSSFSIVVVGVNGGRHCEARERGSHRERHAQPWIASLRSQ
ncbi:MAG: hypothetical protein E6614_32665, partial [Bradyrhizobium sp.]|nr:hypothetical protein [Bradyrhizobium sp.]